jgi:hypothetical protein
MIAPCEVHVMLTYLIKPPIMYASLYYRQASASTILLILSLRARLTNRVKAHLRVVERTLQGE